MLRQSLTLIALSFAVVLLSNQIKPAILYLDQSYDILYDYMSQAFSYAPWGVSLLNISTLVTLPFLITAVPASLYALIKRKQMPHFYSCVWCLWVVLFTSISLAT